MAFVQRLGTEQIPPWTLVYCGKINNNKLKTQRGALLRASPQMSDHFKKKKEPALRFITSLIVARWHEHMAELPSLDELRGAKEAIGSWCVSLTGKLMCVSVTVCSAAFAFQLLAVFGGRPALRLRWTCSCCRSGTCSVDLRLCFLLVGRN